MSFLLYIYFNCAKIFLLIDINYKNYFALEITCQAIKYIEAFFILSILHKIVVSVIIWQISIPARNDTLWISFIFHISFFPNFSFHRYYFEFFCKYFSSFKHFEIGILFRWSWRVLQNAMSKQNVKENWVKYNFTSYLFLIYVYIKVLF